MEIRFLNQPKDGTLGEILMEKLKSGKFARVWLFAGFVKDSGLDYLWEAVREAREKGTMVDCVFGVDKKNTSKDMLHKYLEIGCKVRYHKNEEEAKLETRVYAFESDTAESYVYATGAKLSEGGLTENRALITEISYAHSEKKEFNKAKANMENGVTGEEFPSLTEDVLKELASSGEIMARIIERKIPSIRELYHGGEVAVGVQEYDEGSATNFNELAKQDFDIAIDVSGVTVQNSLGEEVEQKLKTKPKEEETTIVSKRVVTDQEVNYEGMSTLILPVNHVPAKGVGAGEIKIPRSMASKMNTFFQYPSAFHMEVNEKGKWQEVQTIQLEIFENSTHTNQTVEAALIQTEKNLILKAERFTEMNIAENDMMRLMKQGEGKYRCEIIHQESTEYAIWENFCTIGIRGNRKRYGIS